MLDLLPLDPEERFVISSMSRSEIAEDFNTALSLLGQPPQFESNDPRLTAKVCGEYVAELDGINVEFLAYDDGGHDSKTTHCQITIINEILGTSHAYHDDEDDYDPTDPDGSGQDY